MKIWVVDYKCMIFSKWSDAWKYEVNCCLVLLQIWITIYLSIKIVLDLIKSDFREPLNIGSDEMVSINEMAEMILSFENEKIPIHPIPGPESLRSRNSDDTLINEKLGWAPTMKQKAQWEASILVNLFMII